MWKLSSDPFTIDVLVYLFLRATGRWLPCYPDHTDNKWKLLGQNNVRYGYSIIRDCCLPLFVRGVTLCG